MKDVSRLSNDWKQWIAENKMLGCDNRTLVEVLVNNGIGQHTASAGVEDIAASPCVQAGSRLAQRLRKLQSLLSIRQRLSSLAYRCDVIERKHKLSATEFLERHYAVNRPVVLLGLMDDWKACTRWTPKYFGTTFGDEIIEVMTGRTADPQYEINSNKHKTSMTFGDYIRRLRKVHKSNDFYLVANNGLMERPSMKVLYNDIKIFTDYLEPTKTAGRVFFWFGPRGTVTPLHHDTMNILMAQVYGRKRITLISPEQTSLVYNNRSVYGDVDCENPDYSRHPLFRNVRPLQVLLEPGEVLFLPVGWWHHVRAIDISITMTFTNFRFPNEFHWEQPSII